MSNRSGEAQRARISRFVRDQPGVHFRALQRSLGLAPGQAMHHLRCLVAAGFIVEEEGQGYVHYFVNGAPRAPRRLLATLRQPVRLRLVQAMLACGPRSTQALADAAGCSASTAHHHLEVLVRVGAVLRAPGTPARHALTAEGLDVLATLARVPLAPVQTAPLLLVTLQEGSAAVPPMAEPALVLA